jgi:hypothetical protein
VERVGGKLDATWVLGIGLGELAAGRADVGIEKEPGDDQQSRYVLEWLVTLLVNQLGEEDNQAASRRSGCR